MSYAQQHVNEAIAILNKMDVDAIEKMAVLRSEEHTSELQSLA